MLAGLTGVFVTKVEQDDRISAEVSAQVSVAVESGVDFVDSSQIEQAVQGAGLDEETSTAIVDSYESAQLQALKTGLLAAALLALLSLAFNKDLPHEAKSEEQPDSERDSASAAAAG